MSTLKIVILTLLALYLALVTTGAYYGCLFLYFVVMRGRVPRPAASTPPASRFNAANCSTLSSDAREASPLGDAGLPFLFLSSVPHLQIIPLLQIRPHDQWRRPACRRRCWTLA